MLTHFKAIESVKSAQRGNKMGKKIDPGRSRLGKKIGRLEVYTPPSSCPISHLKYFDEQQRFESEPTK